MIHLRVKDRYFLRSFQRAPKFRTREKCAKIHKRRMKRYLKTWHILVPSWSLQDRSSSRRSDLTVGEAAISSTLARRTFHEELHRVVRGENSRGMSKRFRRSLVGRRNERASRWKKARNERYRWWDLVSTTRENHVSAPRNAFVKHFVERGKGDRA